MADEVHHHKSDECESTIKTEVETQDRGLFDFMGKKEQEKKPEEVIVTEFEKVTVSEPEPKIEGCKEEEKKPSLLEKLHRSGSSSSSSSSDEEEVEEGGEKKKKKKGIKDKIKEKISGDDKEEKKVEEDTSVPVEKCEEVVHAEPTYETDEKKGFLDKFKDKLPGHKKTEEVPPPPPPAPVAEYATSDGEAKEKKGIFEKIKEKLPGYHPKAEEEKKECA